MSSENDKNGPTDNDEFEVKLHKWNFRLSSILSTNWAAFSLRPFKMTIHPNQRFKYCRPFTSVNRHKKILFCLPIYSFIGFNFFVHFYGMETTHFYRFHSCDIILDVYCSASFVHKFTYGLEKELLRGEEKTFKTQNTSLTQAQTSHEWVAKSKRKQ